MAEKKDGQGKIEISVGTINFSGEGDQSWLAQQIDKVLEAAKSVEAPDSAQVAAQTPPGGAAQVGVGKKQVGTLASYLKEKNANDSQVKKFLATAAWLYHRKPRPMTSKDVSEALKDHHQKKLTNPAQCLIRNTERGYCEKSKDGFFITPDGWISLGEEQ